MFSLIVSVKDEKKLNSVLLPSLKIVDTYLCKNKNPPLQLIIVKGNKSLTKNYNDGLKQCHYQTKFFIHEDVDLRDNDNNPLFININQLFNSYPDTGLIGLVGTTENPYGFWWNCSRESIVGHVVCNGEYWKWDIGKPCYDVNLIDGMFMATNKNIQFSEDIEGFHFYDLDYCQVMKKAGYKIKVVPHLVEHKATSKDIAHIDPTYYCKKWNISSVKLNPDTKLLVMCSSHQRPDRVRDTIKSFNETKSAGTELILYVADNDPHIEKYRVMLQETSQKHIIGPYKTMVEVLNYLSCDCFPNLPYYAEVNDDHVYRSKEWDKKLIEAIDKKKGWAIAYGFTENLPTAIMISGKLIRTLGFFLPPNFSHTHVDNYIMDIGKTLDLLTQVPEVMIDHLHFNFGKAPLDDNYKVVNDISTLTVGEKALAFWNENNRENDINRIKLAMEQKHDA